MYERDLNRLLTLTLIGSAQSESPMLLRGETTSSRAGRAGATVFLKECNSLMQRVGVTKDSLNVSQAANPSLAIRNTLSGGSRQNFSMVVLPVRHELCRSSWMSASTAIGSGLARPELYIASVKGQVKRVAPHVMAAYKRDLIHMNMHEVVNCQPLADGITSDFCSLARKANCLNGVPKNGWFIVEKPY